MILQSLQILIILIHNLQNPVTIKVKFIKIFKNEIFRIDFIL